MTPLILGIALILAAPSDSPPPKVETVTRSGRVVPLADALKARGVPADTEPIAKQVVLVEAGRHHHAGSSQTSPAALYSRTNG